MPEDETNQAANRAPSSGDPALIKDLKRYDNPEVFGDSALPQYYGSKYLTFPTAQFSSYKLTAKNCLTCCARDSFICRAPIKTKNHLKVGAVGKKREPPCFRMRHS